MLLVFDVGNTNIVVGCFEGENLLTEIRLKSDPGRTVDEYAVALLLLFEKDLGKNVVFDGCVISSVVPPITPDLVRLVEERFKITPLIIGPGIKTGIGVKVSEPGSVGADRIVNCAAAKILYGAPALIIDFGTATTFEYLSPEGNYEGGVIAPGPAIAAESLFKNTAKLPRIDLTWPTSVVGKTTVSQLHAGVVMGYASLIDGLIGRFEAELGALPRVIATGGLGALFARHCPRITTYAPHLTLHGMRLIAELNKS